MILGDVRIRWGVVREPRQLVMRFSVGEAMDEYVIPMGETEGVKEHVEGAIDVLINSGVLAPEFRNLGIGLSAILFENWGHRWESAS